jgi:hypothetical protein
MAPTRKSKTAPLFDFKIRFPADVRERIVAKAAKTGWPQNRVIINELADYPRLERIEKLADQVAEMDDVLARYSARIVMHDLADELLEAVDTILKTEGSAQQAAIDKLRVARHAMLKTKP